MRLEVRVIPGAKKNCFAEDARGVRVYLTAPPIEGKANDALVDFLAEHFSVRRSQIEIIKGLKSRNKVINIEAV